MARQAEAAVSSVCYTQAALAFFRTFLRELNLGHVIKQEVRDKGEVLVKASVKIIWTTLRPIYECLGAQVLEETVLS